MSLRKLHVSSELSLPQEVATSTTIVYGGKGMGKTNFLAVLVEECAAAGIRFSLIDPVGASWGLRHSKSGKQKGVEILVLGGRHGDYPILPTAGAIIADLVADESVNTLIDISSSADGKMWSHGEKIRFVTAYATRLFERQGEKRETLLQIIDEAGRFVPQAIPSGAVDIAKCVGAIEQLVELGRNVAVGVCLVTQRSARMNKSVSELADCMIAFRTVGPRSIDAILDWFGEHIPKKRWEGLVEQLRELDIGSALCVSPGWLKFEGVIHVRERETFDSSATPKPGERRTAPGPAAKPDVEQYLERIESLVEEAEKNDPKRLQAELTRVRGDYREIDSLLKSRGFLVESDDTRWRLVQQAFGELESKAKSAKPSKDPGAVRALGAEVLSAHKVFEKRVARNAQLATKAIADLESIAKELSSEYASLESAVSHAIDRAKEEPAPASMGSPIVPATFRRAPPPTQGRGEGDPTVGKTGLRRMLVALAQNPAGLTLTQLSILTSIAKNGGTFRTYLGKGKTCGWIGEIDNGVAITDSGFAALGSYEPLPTGTDLLQHWIRELGDTGAAKMLAIIAYGPCTRAQLSSASDIALEGGTFRTYIGKLKTLELVSERDGIITLSPDLE